MYRRLEHTVGYLNQISGNDGLPEREMAELSQDSVGVS